MCSVRALHKFFLQCQCRLLSCVPHCEDGIKKHLKGDFLLLFTQVRRFLFLTSSWLQSLYSSILSLLLPSVFIPRNPKQGGKSSISAENHLGRHAVNYFPGCFAVGNEGTSQRMETQPSVYDQLLLFFGFASVSWNYTDVYQSDFILLQVEVNIQ